MIRSTPRCRAAASIAATAFLAALVAAQSPLNRTSTIGTNLAEHSYYASEWTFANVFEHAAPWWPQSTTSSTWDTGQPLDLDADGWVHSLQPGQAAGTLIFRNVDGHYPAGRYVLTYEGDGDLQVGFDGRIASQTAGRIDIDVTPSDAGIYLKLVRTDPNDYLRRIRLVHQSLQGWTSAFHPRFLATWGLCRVLRFMDWQATNDSTVRECADRTPDTWYTEDAPAGVSLQAMIDLCNELGADPWFCMPHMASDDYVRQFATQVRDQLDPRLQVYVEYSNEVWNSQFDQYDWAQQQGQALGLASGAPLAGLRYYARRSNEIHDLWVQVFGGSGRLVRVLASQAANPWIGVQIMDWQNAYRKADVLAIAPYFGGKMGNPATQAQVATWSVPQVLYNAFQSVDTVMDDVAQGAADAWQRGLRLVAYEGGQHLVGYGGAENNTALTTLFHDANRHPWMGLITGYYLERWRQNGGTLMVSYNSTATYSKWGAWGVLEHADQDPLTAPKFFALIDYLVRNPRWW